MSRSLSAVASAAQSGERDHQRSRRGAERLETKSLIEGDGALINGVDDRGTNSNLLGGMAYTRERIVEQRGAESAALVARVDR